MYQNNSLLKKIINLLYSVKRTFYNAPATESLLVPNVGIRQGLDACHLGLVHHIITEGWTPPLTLVFSVELLVEDSRLSTSNKNP